MASFLERLKAFDAHGKLNDDYRVQTVTGAGGEGSATCQAMPHLHNARFFAVTVCAIFIVASMFISQLVWYFSVVRAAAMPVCCAVKQWCIAEIPQEKIETMAVDELQNVRLRINFDVTFPS